MNYDGFFDQLRHQMAERYGQPIEAALMVHRAPDTPRMGLHINNVLVMTPTHLHLVALGGRSGVKPRKDVAAWTRPMVVVDTYDTERSTWFASTGNHYTYDVHRIRVAGPDLTMVVDVMQENHFSNPQAELRLILQAVGREAMA